jgi:hypothetical protein
VSLANPKEAKVKNTASKKITIDFRGVVRHGLTRLMRFGVFLFDRSAIGSCKIGPLRWIVDFPAHEMEWSSIRAAALRELAQA